MQRSYFLTLFLIAATACAAVPTGGGVVAGAAQRRCPPMASAGYGAPVISSAAPEFASNRRDERLGLPLKSLRTFAKMRRRKRGGIYARFSTRYQASIQDQIRACREWAEANDIEI